MADNETPLTTVQNPAPTAEEQQAREAAVTANMEAAGQPTTESGQHDYFGFSVVERVTLPDGVSYVEHKTMNEGARRKYLNAVNREVHLSRSSGDAKINTAPGDERKALLEAVLVGWNLVRNGAPVEFTPHNVRVFLTDTDPKILEIVEKDVRKNNPWLLADMTLEDIDKEIENLEELRREKVKQEEGKAV